MRVLYIAGSGRSGSTLLARLLGQVEGIASVGEIRHIWNTGALLRSPAELCGCGEPYDRCPLWSAVAESVFPDLDPAALERIRALARSVDRVRYVPWMLGWLAPTAYRERLERYRTIALDLYRAIGAHSGSDLVVDASKDPSTLYLLAAMPEVDVTVIHLVRDARGVAYSWKRRRLLRPEFRDQAVYMKQHPVRQTAGFWLYCNLLAEASSRLHDSYLRVRYEDFVRRPREALAGICRAAGVRSPSLAFLDEPTVLLRTPTHILSGNPNRFSGPGVRFALDEEWRTAMPRGDRLAARLVAWPLLARYGYLTGRSQRRNR